MNEDIIIKDYYGDGTSESTNLLVGQHENGNIYAYIPESGLKSDAVSLLADQSIANQALGGEELAYLFPWWFLGAAALAGGIAVMGGADTSSEDTSSKTSELVAAQAAVEAAVKAKEAAEKALSETENGLVTPAEKKAVEDANQALSDAKAQAQEKVDALGDDVSEKAALQSTLTGLNPVAVPDVTDANNNGKLDTEEPVPQISSLKAVDDVIVDSKQDAIYKIMNSKGAYDLTSTRGEISSGGFTNDKTPTFTITLDKPLEENQEIVVYRTEEVRKGTYVNENVITPISVSNTEYTFTDNLPDTSDTKYRYVAYVRENGSEKAPSVKEFILNLDTRAESWLLEDKTDPKKPRDPYTFVANDLEQGSQYVLVDTSGRELAKGRVDSSGSATFVIPNTTQGATLYFSDKVGNVNKTKLNIVNGIWRDIDNNTGIDPTTSNNNNTSQEPSTSANAIKATNDNDYFLLKGNSGIGGNTTKYPINIDLAAGDDTLIIKGAIAPTVGIKMGTGDDRIDLYSTLSSQNGERNVYLDSSNTDAAGDGNDVLYFHRTGERIDGDSGLVRANIYLGGGDNVARIEDRLNGSSIYGGSGQDNIYVYDNMEQRSRPSVKQSIIETKEGNDVVEIRGDILNDSLINLGSGDDVLIMGGGIGSNTVGINSRVSIKDATVVKGGDGFDTLVLSNSRVDYNLGKNEGAVKKDGIQVIDLTDNKVSITGFERFDITGTKNNTLKLSTEDVLNNAGDFSLFGNQYNKTMIIQGDGGDTVTLSGLATKLAQNKVIDGTTYHQYTINNGAATLLIDNEVTINLIQ